MADKQLPSGKSSGLRNEQLTEHILSRNVVMERNKNSDGIEEKKRNQKGSYCLASPREESNRKRQQTTEKIGENYGKRCCAAFEHEEKPKEDMFKSDYKDKENLISCMSDVKSDENPQAYMNMKDQNAKHETPEDVLFSYLMRGEEPDKQTQKSIRRAKHFSSYLYDHRDHWSNYSWYEWCCQVLSSEQTFDKFYKRLNNAQIELDDLLVNTSDLLLNSNSSVLMERLIERLSYEDLHQILLNIRNRKGQTCVFFISGCKPFVTLYNTHKYDLYDLLSTQDINGKTALHVNVDRITVLLADTYIPKQRQVFIELTKIVDNNGKTALEVTHRREDRDKLSSLIKRVENNEYVTDTCSDTNILIIYNTNNRSGAEEEAQTIFDALKSQYWQNNIDMKKNLPADQIIHTIEQAAKTVISNSLKSLVVILASHGSVGTIGDCDGNAIKLATIEEAMCSDVLDGRPKMLITQCCQNRADQLGDEDVYATTHKDFCAVMSCVAGETSTRGVFLTKLSEEIRRGQKRMNIFKIVTNVSRAMEMEKHKQTPTLFTTLTAKFCPTDDWDEEI